MTALTLEQLGVITETIPCSECGEPTIVHALGWDAMPDVGRYVGSCCRKYIGDIDWTERMTLAERAEALDALYAEIPAIACRGLCVESCGPFPPYPAETQRLLYEVGSAPSVDRWTCPLLVKGRCRAHAIRPLLCRLWGVVDGMPCEWGCVPERRYTDAAAHALARRVAEVE